MTANDTLYVFHQAADARRFNRSSENARADFETLPFSLGGSGKSAPPEELLRSRFSKYPQALVNLIKGIDYLISLSGDEEIDVLNLSLGPKSRHFDPADPLQVAVRAVYDRGIPVVVAAGNGGPADGTLQPLALAPWTIAVGASDMHGIHLLDSSSRGRPGARAPTVVSDGYSHKVIVGGPNFAPGTSFAAGKVSHLVPWIKRCLHLVADYASDIASGSWPQQSPALRLPIVGMADTGWDPRAADPFPPEVSALLKSGSDSISLRRSSSVRGWMVRVAEFFDAAGLHLRPSVNPDLIERALGMMAKPMPGYQTHEVGAGFVSATQVSDFFCAFTPSRLAMLLCPEPANARVLRLTETIDDKVGPLWNVDFVRVTQTYFYFGYRMAVAKVVR